ncbi:MAG: hypothetical protein V4739_01860 [Pseudomonadota bacterium]
MTYTISQTCFFFPWGLTPSECAAWVQTWGTLAALAGSVGLVLWQARRQQDAGQRLREVERAQTAAALVGLAKNARTLQIQLSEKLSSRDALESAERSGLPIDMTELLALERALEHLPLRDLEPLLLGPASLVSSSLRQFRLSVERLLANHRSLDDADLEAHLEVLTSLSFTLQEAASDLESPTSVRAAL